MNYYYDLEFLEGTQKTFLGFKTKPTIDFISIGMVNEEGKEFYEVSKDFNLKEAWNRYDLVINKQYPMGPEYNKVYWIRENVLKNLFSHPRYRNPVINNFAEFKRLINLWGLSNKQIGLELKKFIYDSEKCPYEYMNGCFYFSKLVGEIDFYGYYSAYDHVGLCWLYGKMMNLPQGFPMYTNDLKQMFDKQQKPYKDSHDPLVANFKLKANYPKQTGEHNSLEDAKWNKRLHEFLKTI